MSDFISSELKRLGLCTTVQHIRTLNGGSISDAACYSTDKGNFFVKTNSDPKARLWFDAESLALERINKAVLGLAPNPIAHSSEDQSNADCYIVTDYIQRDNSSVSSSSTSIQQALGHALFQLHASATPFYPSFFGFDVTSWCGTTELHNAWSSNWCQFYKTQRLVPLLDQVRGQNKDVDRLGASLCHRLEHWLGIDAIGETVSPSLIHGDLWSGNWCVSSNKKPVLFDPAAYYAHYEVEFGIMRMFGGFTEACYNAYDDDLINRPGSSIQPTTLEGRNDRLLIYEAYHHLNHFAMFGGGYSSGFIDLIDKLL